MTDSYKTINKATEGLFKDRGSKFLAFCYPVNNEDEIKNILKDLRKEYFDARHHCYAYRLGADKSKFRANDDGEPSNTAGKPILGQIQSFDITNILIVVIRYFGGTLLGVGGLIVAYRSAALDALKRAEIVEKTVKSLIDIRFDYKDMNNVMKILKSKRVKQLIQTFNLDCYIRLSIRQSEAEALVSRFKKIETLQYEVVSK